MALFYGAIFLDETITVAAIVGLAVILGGVAIASRPKKAPLRWPHVRRWRALPDSVLVSAAWT